MDKDSIIPSLESITDPVTLIQKASEYFGDELLLASSLGVEDQVLTHMFLNVTPKARIFVLDTGRLPQESYDTMEATMLHYSMQYELCTPSASKLRAMLTKKGPNSFYYSVENRKECCYIRKVLPLQEKLSTCKAWITGLRREQSENRKNIPRVQWDAPYKIVKLNPLAAWNSDAVWNYIQEHSIPYNALHDKGYPSIGCAPCTRAVKPGEPARAGRWWWEDPKNNECGLHQRS